MLIHIPTPLRAYTNQQESVDVIGTTVAGSLEALVAMYPDLRTNLFTAEGNLRSFVNVYLNEEDVRYLPEKEKTSVSDKDELTIIPSIAGGIS
jgi:adenylyltransferase/sulfurtransferase